MAYTVPPHTGLSKVAALIQNCANVSCSWLNMGDSKTTDGSTAANLGYGMARTWPVAAWKFRVGRGNMGPAAWSTWGSSATIGGSSGTSRAPGDTFTGSQTNLAPVTCTDWSFTSNIADASDSIIASSIMVDAFNYASGDVWTSNACFARQSWYRATSNVASVRVSGGRNTAATDASWTLGGYSDVTATTNGAAGWQYSDVTCGSGTGRPIVAVRENSINESTGGATKLIIGPRVFFRGTAGSPATGFGLGDIATGGYDYTSLLRCIGGTGSRTCSEANAAWFWTNVYQNPNVVHVDVSQNFTLNSGTQTELNAGTGTTYRADNVALMNQINAIADLAGVTRPLIIFANSYRTGYSDTHYETRASVLYELATTYGHAFIDYTQLMAKSPNATSWWCGNEDVHPSGYNIGSSGNTNVGNGAEYWASVLWNAIQGSRLVARSGAAVYVQ